MKKLQIMAGMLSVLLLAGCGGAGASAKTTEGDPPQVASAAASGTTAAQNGNENPSEAAAQGQDEKPGASDAAPGQVTEKDSSAGDAKPAVGKTPARENGASAPSKAGPAGGESSDSAGSSSSKPAGNSPSVPAGSGAAGSAEEKPAPQPEEKGFDMDYWLAYAKDYAVGIGLRLDENAADSWDTPIRCSSKTKDVLAAYIRDDLTYYKNEEGCTAVWIWAEQVGDGQYELFIGRG